MLERGGKETNYNGQLFRSKTEARWAVFFDVLAVTYSYEPETITLSTGEKYLPDFYIQDFKAFLEVKPSSEAIVTEECKKARQLSYDRPGQRVWLTIGAPAPKTPNVLPLEQWSQEVSIEEILATAKNRYWFHEDRRDERLYWLHSVGAHGFVVGGPGISTDHTREPLNHRYVEQAYHEALKAFPE